jgi:hypothetical protein
LKSRKNTNFGLEGVDYGLSPYISSVWEVKQCLTSSARSYLLKHISANSVYFVYIILPSSLYDKTRVNTNEWILKTCMLISLKIPIKKYNFKSRQKLGKKEITN